MCSSKGIIKDDPLSDTQYPSSKKPNITTKFAGFTLELATTALGFQMLGESVLDAAREYVKNVLEEKPAGNMSAFGPEPISETMSMTEHDIKYSTEDTLESTNAMLTETLTALPQIKFSSAKLSTAPSKELPVSSPYMENLIQNNTTLPPESGKRTALRPRMYEMSREQLSPRGKSEYVKAHTDSLSFYLFNKHDEDQEVDDLTADILSESPKVKTPCTMLSNVRGNDGHLAVPSKLEFAMPPPIQTPKPLLLNRMPSPNHRFAVEVGRNADNELPHHASYGSDQWAFIDSGELPSLPDFNLTQGDLSYLNSTKSPLPARRMALVSPRVASPPSATMPEISPSRLLPLNSPLCLDLSSDFPDLQGTASAHSIEPLGDSFGPDDVFVATENEDEKHFLPLPADLSASMCFSMVELEHTPSILQTKEPEKKPSPWAGFASGGLGNGDILEDSFIFDSKNDLSISNYPEWSRPGPALDEAIKKQECIDPREIFGEFMPVDINDLLGSSSRKRICASPPPIIKPWEPLPHFSNFPLCNFRLNDPRGISFQNKANLPKRACPPNVSISIAARPPPQKSRSLYKPPLGHCSKRNSITKPTFRANFPWHRVPEKK